MIHRTIIVAVLATLAAITATSLTASHNLIYDFITNTNYANIMRISLMAILVSLLVIRPPRAAAFRVFLGGLAVTLLGLSWYGLNTYTLSLIDAVMLGQVSLIFATEALENGLATEKKSYSNS